MSKEMGDFVAFLEHVSELRPPGGTYADECAIRNAVRRAKRKPGCGRRGFGDYHRPYVIGRFSGEEINEIKRRHANGERASLCVEYGLSISSLRKLMLGELPGQKEKEGGR